MLRRTLVPTLLATLAVATVTAATTAVAAPNRPSLAKWPPWISIESPVNPYDASSRNAAFLVHALVREGTPALTDVTGAAEGMVDGKRQSITLHFDATSRPGVFAVRRQWPSEGTWLLRISLFSTTALVSLDRAGNVAGVRLPTVVASGSVVPRPILAREIDSTLAEAAKR
ncbi:MAG TPA: hypothetical protein VK636_21270 [Gemmatimonadaceae bacterium]|nr:hypothetical protein [Gemmatimonadaceae bacterium]